MKGDLMSAFFKLIPYGDIADIKTYFPSSKDPSCKEGEGGTKWISTFYMGIANIKA